MGYTLRELNLKNIEYGHQETALQRLEDCVKAFTPHMDGGEWNIYSEKPDGETVLLYASTEDFPVLEFYIDINPSGFLTEVEVLVWANTEGQNATFHEIYRNRFESGYAILQNHAEKILDNLQEGLKW